MPQLGAAIGGLIGGWISPTQVNGPHIGDGAAQSSAEGQAIPWIIATCGWVQGNIIQISPRREVKKTDDGKGSGTEVNTFEAHQDFCILICESSETRDSLMVGVLIVKVDGKIVYDMRPGKNFSAQNAKFLRNHTFYNGNESQVPDPTMEAIVGVDNALAYRGVYTMVARDINLSQYGERIPVYEFVMVGQGDAIIDETTELTVSEYGKFRLSDWPLASPSSMYSYRCFWTTPSAGGIQSPVFDTIEECNEWFDAETGETAPTNYIGYISNTIGTAGTYNTGQDGFGNAQKFSRISAQIDPADLTSVLLLYQFVLPSSYLDVAPNAACGLAPEWTGIFNGSVVRQGPFTTDYLVFQNCGGGVFTYGYYPYCIQVFPKRPPPDESPVGDPCAIGVPVKLPDVPGYRIDCAGNVTPEPVVTPQVGTFFVLQVESFDTTDNIERYVLRTLGPVTPDAVTPDPDFWEPAYDESVLAGTSPPGWIFGVDYPTTTNDDIYELSYETTTLYEDTLELGTAITRIAERGGLTASDLDVTEMNQDLLGYMVTQSYNGADCIRPLMTAFTSYGSEYDAKLRFHKHGEPIEILVDPEDFIEGSETDKSTREQAVEYPRLLSVTAIDPTQDYLSRPQTERRITPDVRAIGEESLQVPVVMAPDSQRQLAAIGMKVSWARAQGTREFSVPYVQSDKYLHLVSGKPFALDGKRYIASEYGLEDGEIKIKGLYDRQSAYTSDITATPALPPTPPPFSLGGVTVFAVMNLPSLRSQDNVPGVYAAACGILDSWPGCSLQMSIDNGVTWTTAIASMTQPSVIGSIISVEETSSGPIYGVVVNGGQLVSVTDEALTNGANASAITTNDISEVLQFQDAVELSENNYEISDLVRGQLGTTEAEHLIGDRFVKLDAVYFVPLDQGLAGRTILFRPVTFGTAPELNAIYSLVFEPPTFIIDGGEVT